jgi:hypothetical protein
MTSVNTKKGGLDFKGNHGGDEEMDEGEEEELDDSSFALRGEPSGIVGAGGDQEFVVLDEDPDMTIHFTTPQ